MTVPDDPFVPLDRQLCFSLYGAAMAMNRVYKPLLDRLGITYPQYLALHVLWEEDDRTLGAIAERLSLEPSTVTPLVRRLAEAGFVTRERDPRDERQVRIRLSAAGHALRGDSACVARQVFARTGLSPERLATLTDELHALRRTLADGALPA